MSARASAAQEKLEVALTAAGARKREIDAEREANRKILHQLYERGSKLGMKAGAMARLTGQNEQVVRNILNGVTTYAAKKEAGRV